MKNTIICTISGIFLLGLFTIVSYGQSTTATSAVNANAGTVTALLQNTSNKSVLIWTNENLPQTLADTAKFRVAPGSTRKLVVTVPSNGQVKFTASSGPPPDKSSILGVTLGNCIWRQEPNAPAKVPSVVFNGSSLTCGTTTR